MDINQARAELISLKYEPKYTAMLKTAAIITELLDREGIKPIIVGGLSVEIYTQSDYSTRDIDFVSSGFEKISQILFSLGFERKTRHFYHTEIEVAVEIPSSDLAGAYGKVVKLDVGDKRFVYVISIEDIILDRLRGTIAWNSEDDRIWGFRLLAGNIDRVDREYLFKNCENKKEKTELSDWFTELDN